MDIGARPIAIGMGLFLVVVLGVWGAWSLRPAAGPIVPASLTEVTGSAEIAGTVELSHVGIMTSTNYLGHKVYLVKGTLRNVSSNPLRTIDVKMTFKGYDGKAIHEEVHTAFELKEKPLQPGTDYQFERAFENLPRTWNYRVPAAEIVKAAY